MNINLGEIFEIRKAYYPLLFRIFGIYVIADIVLAIVWVIAISAQIINGSNVYSYGWLAVLMFIKFVIVLILSVRLTVDWTFTYFMIRDNNLVKMQGFYTPKETTYDLSQIYSIETYQSAIGRALKYGDLNLTFSTQPNNREKVHIWGIVEPFKYQKYFQGFRKK